MSTPQPAVPDSVESIQSLWLRQRDELERELFGGWNPTFVATPQTLTPVAQETSKPTVSVMTPSPVAMKSQEAVPTNQTAWMQQADETTAKERLANQRQLEQEVARQKQAAQAELTRQRGVVEQELTAREKAWNEQRDKEWATLKHAKEIHEQSVNHLRDELAAQRVQEREQVLAWKQQAEAQLAETRRQHDHERLRQQHEQTRQLEVERERLRQERAEMARQLETERERLRDERSEQIHLIDAEREKLHHERAEMERLRDVLREKFRREQVVLQNSMQFFEQNLTRVSDELRTPSSNNRAIQESAAPAVERVVRSAPAPQPTTLTLDQIREKLNQMKQPELKKAA